MTRSLRQAQASHSLSSTSEIRPRLKPFIGFAEPFSDESQSVTHTFKYLLRIRGSKWPGLKLQADGTGVATTSERAEELFQGEPALTGETMLVGP